MDDELLAASPAVRPYVQVLQVRRRGVWDGTHVHVVTCSVCVLHHHIYIYLFFLYSEYASSAPLGVSIV